jgi:PAS domain S-box-containing protein
MSLKPSYEFLLAAVLESVGEAIITIDSASTIVMVNHEVEEIWGYTDAELLGQPLLLLMPESYHRHHLAGLTRYLVTGKAHVLGHRIEVEGRKKDGTIFPMELRIQETRTDENLFFTAAVRDLTQQKQAMRRLAAQYAVTRILADATSLDEAAPALLRAIAEGLDWQVGVLWRRDRATNVLRFKAQWHQESVDVSAFIAHSQQLTFLPGAGFPGRVWQQVRPLLIADVTRDQAFLRRDAAHVDALHTAFGFPILLGSDVLGVVECFSQQISDPDSALLSMLAAIGSQIGQFMERRRVEAEREALVRELEGAVQIRDQFLSIASHELKTPITGLLLQIELLERRFQRAGEINTPQQRGLRGVWEQARRLNRLSNALLDVSRIEHGRLLIERQPVALEMLVRRIVEEKQPLWDRHVFQMFCTDGGLVVMCDELRLEQVFHNLLDNAVKYSPQGGLIEVRLERRADQATIQVRDEGIGIPTEAFPNLFNRFFRAGNMDHAYIGGLGIGLYLVKEIVAQHGGAIEVESTEGQGSTFTVYLPLHT